jgi:hypothetical protein
MRKIILFIPLIIVFIVGCTDSQNNMEEKMADSVIEKIDNNEINELNEDERAYFQNLLEKAIKGEELTAEETRVHEKMGELNPARLLPDVCFLRPPFNCNRFIVSKTQVQLVISQSFGLDLKNVEVSVGSCEESATLDVLKDGEPHTFILERCNNVESEKTGKINEEFQIKAEKDDTGLFISLIGELRSKVN